MHFFVAPLHSVVDRPSRPYTCQVSRTSRESRAFSLNSRFSARLNIISRILLPARRCASAGLCDSDVSVRLSVRPSVCLSHAGIVPSRAKAGS